MRNRILVVLALVSILVLSISGTALASPSESSIDHLLAAHHSPLLSWNIAAFAKTHPDFDVEGFLAVAWCESGMGTAGRLNNPGSIKGGKVGTLWRDLRCGVTHNGFNIYPSMYAGQRALIKLLYERGYNKALKNHDWRGFANVYYGKGIAGIERYISNLRCAHARICRELGE